MPSCHRPGAPTGTASPLTLPELSDLIWQHTAAQRRQLHRDAGMSGCPSRQAPYGPEEEGHRPVPPSCFAVGCLDLVHDLLLDVRGKLDKRYSAGGTMPAEPHRYANSVVVNSVRDRRREGRVARGLPAKPTRTDGVAGRVIAALRDEASDPDASAWRVTLFGLVRAYPCTLGWPGRNWPLDAWSQEKTRRDRQLRDIGSIAARTEISNDIEEVLRTADEVAGPQWRYDNITQPMLHGTDPIPHDLVPEWHPDHPTEAGPDDEVLMLLFESCYAQLCADDPGLTPAGRRAAARAAARRIFGEPGAAMGPGLEVAG